MAVEAERGCGFRRVGGLYLVGAGEWYACCRLPTLIDACPTCGGGIKFTRNIQFMLPKALFKVAPACLTAMPMAPTMRADCPLATVEESTAKIALVWIGEETYAAPADFMTEARTLGISRRIATLPKDLTLGVTRVMLAHRKVIKCPQAEHHDSEEGGKAMVSNPDEKRMDPCPACNGEIFLPGVFASFVPQKIERVVTVTMANIAHEWLAMEQMYQAAVRLAEERGEFRAEWMDPASTGPTDHIPQPLKAKDARQKIVDELARLFNKDASEIAGFEWVKNDLNRGIDLFPVPDDDPDHAPRATKKRALPKMPTKAEARAKETDDEARRRAGFPTLAEIKSDDAED